MVPKIYRDLTVLGKVREYCYLKFILIQVEDPNFESSGGACPKIPLNGLGHAVEINLSLKRLVKYVRIILN